MENTDTQKEWVLTCISFQTWLFWVQSGPLLYIVINGVITPFRRPLHMYITLLITGFCRCPHIIVYLPQISHCFPPIFLYKNQMIHRKMSDPPRKKPSPRTKWRCSSATVKLEVAAVDCNKDAASSQCSPESLGGRLVGREFSRCLHGVNLLSCFE